MKVTKPRFAILRQELVNGEAVRTQVGKALTEFAADDTVKRFRRDHGGQNVYFWYEKIAAEVVP